MLRNHVQNSGPLDFTTWPPLPASRGRPRVPRRADHVLVEFAKRSAHPGRRLRLAGRRREPAAGPPVELWITCRMRTSSRSPRSSATRRAGPSSPTGSPPLGRALRRGVRRLFCVGDDRAGRRLRAGGRQQAGLRPRLRDPRRVGDSGRPRGRPADPRRRPGGARPVVLAGRRRAGRGRLRPHLRARGPLPRRQRQHAHGRGAPRRPRRHRRRGPPPAGAVHHQPCRPRVRPRQRVPTPRALRRAVAGRPRPQPTAAPTGSAPTASPSATSWSGPGSRSVRTALARTERSRRLAARRRPRALRPRRRGQLAGRRRGHRPGRGVRVHHRLRRRRCTDRLHWVVTEAIATAWTSPW